MVNFLCSLRFTTLESARCGSAKNIDSYKSKDYNTNCLNAKIKIGE